MSTENENQRLKNQIQDYQRDIQNLKGEVTKWSQYCAYVAGSSIGIIAFILMFATPEEPECPECDVCPEPIECEACEICPEPVECPEPIECEKTTSGPRPTPKVSTPAPVNVDPTSFPRTYVIQPGDNFSKIAQAVYGRASWAKWLAEQNDVDPSKLQIGQEITLPKPKE